MGRDEEKKLPDTKREGGFLMTLRGKRDHRWTREDKLRKRTDEYVIK